MNMQRTFLFVVTLLVSSCVRAQAAHCPECPPSDSDIPQYRLPGGNDLSLSALMLRTYDGDRTPSYVMWTAANEASQSHDATHPLNEGEGRSGDMFEASADLFFPVISGRNDPRFFPAGFRFGTMFTTTVRMADDFSHPLLPGNWKIGFAGELPICYRGFQRYKDSVASELRSIRNREELVPEGDAGDEQRRGLRAERHRLRDKRSAQFVDTTWQHSRFTYATWRLYHFSNGQDGQFYSDSVARRNNYRTGDFSTNCLELKINRAWRYPSAAMITAGAGFRWDNGIDGVFEYSKQQEDAFGQWRWQAHGQWWSAPFWTGWRLCKSYDHTNGCSYRMREFVQARIRLELEYIAGDMSNYPFANKQRLGAHLWGELITLRSYTTGFFVHAYHGRDYLNIRYDRVVSIFMVGASFSLNKYMPFGWNAVRTIQKKSAVKGDGNGYCQ